MTLVSQPGLHNLTRSTLGEISGAEIVLDTKDEDCGGLGFSCRDLAGRL